MNISFWSLLMLGLLAAQTALAAEKIMNVSEVNAHNGATSCWIIVEDKVYDITKLLDSHKPKCKETKLEDFCGKDASSVWIQKEKSSLGHKRKSILEFTRFQIGTIHNP